MSDLRSAPRSPRCGTSSLRSTSLEPAAPRTSPNHASGFTLVELLVVFVLMITIAAIGVPALQKLFLRSKLMSASQEISSHLLRSRLESMKMSRQVVVAPVYATGTLLSWIDESENQVFDAGTDTELYRLTVPGDTQSSGLFFMGATGNAGTDAVPGESVQGLTLVPSTARKVVVFLPDGSVRDPGSIRISDAETPRRNVIEIRVAPQATARVEIRKYVYDKLAFLPYGASQWDWY